MENVEKKMNTIEMFGELEKKVAYAAEKLKAANEADAAARKAEEEYATAAKDAEKLQSELAVKIAGLLPNPRIRKSQ